MFVIWVPGPTLSILHFFPLFVNEEVAYIFVIKKLGFVNLNKKSQICLIDGIVNILFYSFPNFL